MDNKEVGQDNTNPSRDDGDTPPVQGIIRAQTEVVQFDVNPPFNLRYSTPYRVDYVDASNGAKYKKETQELFLSCEFPNHYFTGQLTELTPYD